LTVLAMFLFDK